MAPAGFQRTKEGCLGGKGLAFVSVEGGTATQVGDKEHPGTPRWVFWDSASSRRQLQGAAPCPPHP